MNYPRYNQVQLEKIAYEVTKKYDASLLQQSRYVDVYDVIEKILDVPYDWKYISPDQSILGATAFSDGYIWAWPKSQYEDGMLPYKVAVDAGTIIIDSTLTENDNRGRENFTVMHEVFHQILHKEYFTGNEEIHYSYTNEVNSVGHKKLITPMDFIEYQANYCAASFLMPRNVVIEVYDKMYNAEAHQKWRLLYYESLIGKLAQEFNVSFTAMKNRISYLNINDYSNE